MKRRRHGSRCYGGRKHPLPNPPPLRGRGDYSGRSLGPLPRIAGEGGERSEPEGAAQKKRPALLQYGAFLFYISKDY